jgi:CubicO group peptidase (beta-lactamase class C family)
VVAVLQSLVLVVSAAVLAASLAPRTPAAPARPSDERVGPGHAGMPHVAPGDVGMSAERLAVIDRVVANAIAAGGFPGAAVIVGRRGAIVWERGYGVLGGGSGAAVDPERTLYDLASLTKVVATSAAAMVLVDQGRLRLDDPVARYLPEFAGGPKSRVTVRHLLTHRSGLPAGRALPRAEPAEARRRVLGTPLEAAPGARVEYSDLGPVVLGLVVERVTGEPLDRFVRRAVHAPLGMRSTTFRPSPTLAARAAVTGARVPRGEVHDRTAHALGGVAGHAGLFATAGDLAVFAQFMLDRGGRDGVRLVHDTTVALFTRPEANSWRALGWQTCPGGGSCGRVLGPTAFGHTGFTGTSLWVDPERELFVIVLTNWVAGRAGGVAPVAVLHDVRSDVADLAALAVVDGPPTAMPDRMRSDVRNGW